MARAPDIIETQQIALSATNDAPVLDTPRPPLSASNDPVDQKDGVAKEITAADLALAEAARKGTLEPAVDGEAETVVETVAEPKTKPKKAVEPDDEIVADLPKNSPSWYVREVAAIRRSEREKTAAAFAAAKAQVGDAAWDAALEATRDKVVAEAKAESARALKEAKDARDALTARDAELTELRTKVPAPEEKKVVEDPRPARDQFDDPDLYDDALTAWGKREGIRETEAQAETARVAAEAAETERVNHEAQEAQTAEVAKIKETWDGRVETAKERYDDFIEVTTKPFEDGGPLVTDAMIAGMMQVENGPDVAYHLGLNVEEAKRIGELRNPGLQLIEIGRLSERLANPPRRARPTPPIEPIDTTGNTADPSLDEPDMDAYYAKRNPELQRNRAPFFPAGRIH
jgi:hypothetical protein